MQRQAALDLTPQPRSLVRLSPETTGGRSEARSTPVLPGVQRGCVTRAGAEYARAAFPRAARRVTLKAWCLHRAYMLPCCTVPQSSRVEAEKICLSHFRRCSLSLNDRRSAIHSTHDAQQKYCMWSSQTIPHIRHVLPLDHGVLQSRRGGAAHIIQSGSRPWLRAAVFNRTSRSSCAPAPCDDQCRRQIDHPFRPQPRSIDTHQYRSGPQSSQERRLAIGARCSRPSPDSGHRAAQVHRPGRAAAPRRSATRPAAGSPPSCCGTGGPAAPPPGKPASVCLWPPRRRGRGSPSPCASAARSCSSARRRAAASTASASRVAPARMSAAS